MNYFGIFGEDVLQFLFLKEYLGVIFVQLRKNQPVN